MRRRAPAVVVTMGANGPRIHDLLAPVAAEGGFALRAADDLAQAVATARTALAAGRRPASGDVILLSPGAPSFGPYRDYVERGRDFARLGGFDPDVISAIPALGIAAAHPAWDRGAPASRDPGARARWAFAQAPRSTACRTSPRSAATASPSPRPSSAASARAAYSRARPMLYSSP